MHSPFYTENDDEIYVSRLAEAAPNHVRLSINPLSSNKAVFLTPDVAEAIGKRLIELAREARA